MISDNYKQYYQQLLQQSSTRFARKKNADDAYHIGASLAALGRFFDAVPYMNYAATHKFNNLQRHIDTISSVERTLLLEYCFNNGLLCKRIKQYQQSYNLLQFAYNQQPNITYMQAMLDSASEGDLPILENLIDYAAQHHKDDDNIIYALGRAKRKISYEATNNFFKNMLEKQPKSIMLHSEYALFLNDMGYGDKAQKVIEKALNIDSKNLILLDNISLICSDNGYINDANYYFGLLHKLNDTQSTYYNNYSKFLFRQGKYDEGLRLNEERLKTTDLVANLTALDIPKWQGEPLKDAHLLILGEQGVGDQINYTATLPYLIEKLRHQNVTITFTCKPKLETVFKRNFPNITVPHEAFLHEHNHYKEWGVTHYCYLVSLLPILGMFSAIHPPEVWLNSSPDTYKKAYDLFSPYKHKKIIGLSAKSGIIDNRSLSMSDLEPLARLPKDKYMFVSLQYGDSDQLIATIKHKINIDIVRVPQVDLFEDIEAVMALTDICDLVIHNDNTNAHIAGAMGKKGYIMLPYQAVWRWGYKETPAHWYKNLKIMRQHTRGDFKQVVNDIVDDILNYHD